MYKLGHNFNQMRPQGWIEGTFRFIFDNKYGSFWGIPQNMKENEKAKRKLQIGSNKE